MSNFAHVIPVDECLHDDKTAFCPDEIYPCHEDEIEVARVAQFVDDGLITPEEATELVKGKNI